MAERNYEFFWQRDGQNVSNIWPRTEHEEIMTEPPGKSLKLGLIEVGILSVFLYVVFISAVPKSAFTYFLGKWY
jgi:hypothetical protein